jgi:PST family polysaccharide transporter
MPSELKKKAVRGAGWLTLGQFANQGMSLVVTGILARLLTPEAFGLVGMVVVFTAFLELFQELGLTAAVIQRKDVTEEQLSTVFWITIFCGATLSLATAAVSPVIAWFYGEPELKSVASLLGLTFFINSFVHVQAALLRKRLQFRRLVLAKIAAALVGGGVGIGLAFAGFGVHALVFKSVAVAALFSGLLWLMGGWRPNRWPRLRSVLGMLTFGGGVTGTYLLSYLSRNMDYMLIGRFLGAAALGVYTIAYRIMLLPLRRITFQLSQVAFPAFSAIQDDKPRVARGYCQMGKTVALVTFPAMAGLLLVAPEAVRVVLGEKWLRAIFLIRVLAPVGALQSVTAASTHLFRSQGRAWFHLVLEFVITAVTLGAFVVGLRWDVEGVAVCYAISQFVLMPAKCYFAFRLVNLRLTRFYRALNGPLWATAAMGAVVLGYRAMVLQWVGMGQMPLLITQIAVGVVAYALALRLLAPSEYADALELLRLLLPGGRGEKTSPEGETAPAG